MSHCEHEAATEPPVAAGACHGPEPTDQDSCCETSARRDYLFWVSLSIVALAYPLGALMPHDHLSMVSVFTSGIYELFNKMWWGIAIGIVFVGILGRMPRELVMAMLGREEGVSSLFRATFRAAKPA